MSLVSFPCDNDLEDSIVPTPSSRGFYHLSVPGVKALQCNLLSHGTSAHTLDPEMAVIILRLADDPPRYRKTQRPRGPRQMLFLDSFTNRDGVN